MNKHELERELSTWTLAYVQDLNYLQGFSLQNPDDVASIRRTLAALSLSFSKIQSINQSLTERFPNKS